MNAVTKYFTVCKCGHHRYKHYLFSAKCDACDCQKYEAKKGRPKNE